MSEPLEPVSQAQFDSLLAAVTRAHGGIGLVISGLCQADVAKGRRPASPGVYEMWTKERKKITIAMTTDGGLCVSCSKEPDPDYPI